MPYADFGIKDFEKFWLTNPNLNIEKTAELFGFGYLRIDDYKKIKINKLYINEIIIF